MRDQKLVPGCSANSYAAVRLPPPLGKEGWGAQRRLGAPDIPPAPSAALCLRGTSRRRRMLRERGVPAYHSTSTLARVPRRPSARRPGPARLYACLPRRPSGPAGGIPQYE